MTQDAIQDSSLKEAYIYHKNLGSERRGTVAWIVSLYAGGLGRTS